MKRVGPILFLIATLAVTAVMYFVEVKNSRSYAFGWGLTALDIFMSLPLIFAIATAVWLLRTPKTHQQTASVGSIERRLGSRTVGPQALFVMVIIVVICLLCWLAALFFIYAADDLASPAWNERSVPAPRTY